MLPAVSARAQLDRIKGHWRQFWFELKDFHDNRRWPELGYTSFKDCVESELHISERHAYRILEAAGVALELRTDPGVSIEGLTERQARALTALPPAERSELARSVDFAATSGPELRKIVAGRRSQKSCCACGVSLDDDRPSEETNHYSFDGTRLWCIPCGRKWLAERYPGYQDPAWEGATIPPAPPGTRPDRERSAAEWIRAAAADLLPVPVVRREHGLDTWFEYVAEEVLTRFDPTWLDWDAPAEIGPLRDADWWAENRPLLDAMSLLLRRLASPACETSALKRNSE